MARKAATPKPETSSLMEKMLKNSTIKLTSVLTESVVFNEKDVIATQIPIVNVALSGDLHGGISPGILQLAGPSKHFKSGFALLMAKSFLQKYSDGIIMLYDSEFGTPAAYFNTYDIDMSKVIHTPITDIEEFTMDFVRQLEPLTRDDHVMFIVDSIGNLASKKEMTDMLDGKSVTDMTRAKTLKTLGRLITTKLNIRNIPCIAINHTYKTLEMFPKDVVSGGSGLYLSANDIWIIGRQQDKNETTKEVEGYNFVVKAEKSRFVKEGSKFPVYISFKNGIERWSGLLDLALEAGFIVKPKQGKYALVDMETGEISETEYNETGIMNNDAFWLQLVENKKFGDYIKDKYQIAGENKKLMETETVEEILAQGDK
jgi:hypothetical protein